jgi:hypothetical protein
MLPPLLLLLMQYAFCAASWLQVAGSTSASWLTK